MAIDEVKGGGGVNQYSTRKHCAMKDGVPIIVSKYSL